MILQSNVFLDGEVSASAVSHPVSAGDCALVRSSETPYSCASPSLGKLTEYVRQAAL